MFDFTYDRPPAIEVSMSMDPFFVIGSAGETILVVVSIVITLPAHQSAECLQEIVMPSINAIEATSTIFFITIIVIIFGGNK